MRSLPNIGLIGKLRAGKDVVAAYLADKYGYTRFAFGDELKRYAHELFGEPASGEKPRELYQWFGQTMRQRDPDVWVGKCLAKVTEFQRWVDTDMLHTPNPNVVITDVRQLNEAKALAERSYLFIRVTAPDAIRIDRAIKSGDKFEYTDLMHGTETELDDYPADFTADNGGTLDELYAQIDTIMEAVAE